MVRRTIRPFTVEVRGSRRKSDASTFHTDEQPDVVWPDALRKELQEDRPDMVEDVLPEKPQGRILPALNEREPPPAPPVEPPVDEVEPEVEDEAIADDSEDGPLAIPAAEEKGDGPVWERRPRKARETFARGERWKARLPAAIHGMRRQPRGEATD